MEKEEGKCKRKIDQSKAIIERRGTDLQDVSEFSFSDLDKSYVSRPKILH